MNTTDIKVLLGFFLALVLLSSCQDVINVSLNNAAPQMVIEGSLSSQPDTVKVVLSRTTDYFNPGNIVPVTDAVVSISDDRGNSYQPASSQGGTYAFPNMSGLPDVTYTLKVQSQGTTYVATSQMPKAVAIDSLKVLPATDGDNENVLYCYIHDPAGVKNYYRIIVYKNDSLLTNNSTVPIIIFTDKYFDGRNTPLTVPSRRFGIKLFLPSDTLKVQLLSIDRSSYEFFKELRDITNTGRFLGSTSTPDNPDNNISNGALGYFSAWSVSEKTLVVKM
jgi:hypothetical protein